LATNGTIGARQLRSEPLSGSCATARSDGQGQNSRFFPPSREFRRFSPDNRRLAAKTVRQINRLPANSRSTANREFTPVQSGIKFAEPGTIPENDRASASSHDGRAAKENQQETHLSVRRNQIKHKSQ
jgi:hypothetical protein